MGNAFLFRLLLTASALRTPGAGANQGIHYEDGESIMGRESRESRFAGEVEARARLRRSDKILEVRRDEVTRPVMKTTLKDALKEREKIRRAGWMN